MSSSMWQKWFNRRPQPSGRHLTARWRFRPRLVMLEDRMAPAVLVVNTLADAGDQAHLDLREALQAVNSGSTAGLSAQQQDQIYGKLGSDDTIQFAKGLTGTVALEQGVLDITSPVAIRGPGQSDLTIDAQQQSRIFTVAANVQAFLSDLTLAHGMFPTHGETGGAILNMGELTVSHTTFSHNSTPPGANGGSGGAIANPYGATLTVSSSTFDSNTAYSAGAILNSGTTTISHSMFTNNSVGNWGGAISSGGTLTVSHSTFLQNHVAGRFGGAINIAFMARATITTSTFDGNGAWTGAGGIMNQGTLTVTRSTFSNNIANNSGSHGGAIQNVGTLTLTNSTLYGNTASNGGGLANSGTATLTSVTVTANVAHNAHGAVQGGGLSEEVGGDPLVLHNSIVAGNFLSVTGGSASDISGTVDNTSSFNLVGTGGTGGLIDGVNGNLVGVADAKLGPLADNGGPTKTVALLADSPAIDAGDPDLLHTKDQRGVRRRLHVSIGAFQVN